MTRPVFVGGRFLSGPQSGVQRAARELVGALDALLEAQPSALDVTLLCPADAAPPDLTAIRTRRLPGRGVAFDQLVLPVAANGGVLLNLANAAPVLHSANVVMLHDAQTRSVPTSYGTAFRLWYAVMQPLVTAAALQVLTVSAYSAVQLARYGLSGRRRPVMVLPNGCEHVRHVAADEAVLSAHGLEAGRYVLALGSSQPHKNMRMLTEAASRPGVPRLALTGSGDGLSLPASVVALGRVDDAALRALYEGALALALPSLEEGFGLPAAEAMACGCPVLAARAGALPEVLGGAGLLLPPDDVGAWADAMTLVAGDAAKRRAMVDAGLVRAEALSWRAGAERLLGVLEQLAARQGVPSVRPTNPSRRPSATSAR